MNQTHLKKVLSGILCVVLSAATALSATGCSGSKADPPASAQSATAVYAPADTPHSLGEGTVAFPLCVQHADGTQVLFNISTGESTVGAALEQVGLIAGEEGPYGLMITEVNGEYHTYEDDRMYWGFYIDGDYAMSGVDSTPISDGQSYMLKAESA